MTRKWIFPLQKIVLQMLSCIDRESMPVPPMPIFTFIIQLIFTLIESWTFLGHAPRDEVGSYGLPTKSLTPKEKSQEF